jgi:hypothetical protein
MLGSLISYLLSNSLLIGLGCFSLTWLLSFVNRRAACVILKVQLYLESFAVMFISRDAVWPTQPDPDLINKREVQNKRLIFIRHGESEWNEVFNRGFHLTAIYRFCRAFFKEICLFATEDSIFIDSPLSPLGFKQAKDLQAFIKEAPPLSPDREILKGEFGASESVLVCSNLRRALATLVVGFQERLKKTSEKILVLTFLQEISRNVDATSLTPHSAIPHFFVPENELPANYNPEKMFDTELNIGNKSIFCNGLTRMRAFCGWAFSRHEPVIVVGSGHSLWFRSFFRTFLPHR